MRPGMKRVDMSGLQLMCLKIKGFTAIVVSTLHSRDMYMTSWQTLQQDDHFEHFVSFICVVSNYDMLVHVNDADKTRLSCLVSTQFPISKCSVILSIFETEQLQIGNWVETRQNSVKLGRDKTKLSYLVISCVHTADTGKTRQNALTYF